MANESGEFYAGYATEDGDGGEAAVSYIDSDRENPIETRCCITGEEVKHGFCRYPDPEIGTMMVMSRDSMIRFSRKGRSLPEEFERVLALRRKKEKRSGRPS